MAMLLDRIRQFQSAVLESGLARSVLALPAPRMLALPAPTEEDLSDDILFGKFIIETEIVDVSRDLFVSGFYNLAVLESAKALDKYVQVKSERSDQYGTTLMDIVFSPKSPILQWSERSSSSEKDEQNGYHRLFSGSMLGIRNPATHEHNWIDDAKTALECIVLVQHLLRKAKSAHLVQAAESPLAVA